MAFSCHRIVVDASNVNTAKENNNKVHIINERSVIVEFKMKVLSISLIKRFFNNLGSFSCNYITHCSVLMFCVFHKYITG